MKYNVFIQHDIFVLLSIYVSSAYKLVLAKKKPCIISLFLESRVNLSLL